MNLTQIFLLHSDQILNPKISKRTISMKKAYSLLRLLFNKLTPLVQSFQPSTKADDSRKDPKKSWGRDLIEQLKGCVCRCLRTGELPGLDVLPCVNWSRGYYGQGDCSALHISVVHLSIRHSQSLKHRLACKLLIGFLPGGGHMSS